MAQHWPRIILHVDMDAFFAQIEQRDEPDYRGQPVCVTNGQLGSCVITCSYEARAYGIKTGMRLTEARQLCPHLIQCPSRPTVYAGVSTQIMQILETVSPDIEIFSVDEAFLDLSRCRNLYTHAKAVGKQIQQAIVSATGLTCSIGISGDKTTAKIGSKRNKPNGVTVIPPWLSASTLAPLKVTEICGISTGIARFLSQYSVYYCGQMATLPIDVMARRFGNLGRRLWYMCLGEDPDPVKTSERPPKSMGHGKVMPPNTRDRHVIFNFLGHMSEKVALRLRAHDMTSQHFFIGLRLEQGWIVEQYKTVQATDDGALIFQLAKAMVLQRWHGEGVFQCQVTALRVQHGSGQRDLFEPYPEKALAVNTVMDQVNQRYGISGVVRGHCLQQLNMPDVIAPAWRPSGHRATVVAKQPHHSALKRRDR